MSDKKTEAVEDKEDKKTDSKLPKEKRNRRCRRSRANPFWRLGKKRNYLRLLEHLRVLDQILMASNPLGPVLNLQIQKRVRPCIQLSYTLQ